VGFNLEDSDHHGSGSLVDLDVQASKIVSVRAAARDLGVDVVINARVDTFVRHLDNAVEEGVRRGRAYLAAGADCVYPIMIQEEADIAAFVNGVGGPVNVNIRPVTPSLAVLRRLNVARVSMGGGLFRIALNAAHDAAAAFQAGTLYT
jgi:2-methylisocitrate lyase-like PEP mutase family enzyme